MLTVGWLIGVALYVILQVGNVFGKSFHSFIHSTRKIFLSCFHRLEIFLCVVHVVADVLEVVYCLLETIGIAAQQR